jgi:hypothetical protein
LAVRGDSRDGSLNGDEIGIIAEKSFASLFSQPFVLAKKITAKIADNDAATSLSRLVGNEFHGGRDILKMLPPLIKIRLVFRGHAKPHIPVPGVPVRWQHLDDVLWPLG